MSLGRYKGNTLFQPLVLSTFIIAFTLARHRCIAFYSNYLIAHGENSALTLSDNSLRLECPNVVFDLLDGQVFERVSSNVLDQSPSILYFDTVSFCCADSVVRINECFIFPRRPNVPLAGPTVSTSMIPPRRMRKHNAGMNCRHVRERHSSSLGSNQIFL